MISLNQWFRRNAELPLVSVTLVVIALAVLQLISSYQSLKKSQQQGFLQMTDLVVLALNQKNQILLESILNASRWQLNASKAELCIGTQSILTSAEGLSLCGKKNVAIFSRYLEIQVPGFSEYELKLVLPLLTNDSSLIVIIIISSVLIFCYFLLIKRMHGRFCEDIVYPIQAGITENKKIGIEELERIRQLQNEAHQVKLNSAVADAIVKRNQQVAHDIRSPVAALDMICKDLQNIPEDYRVIMRIASSRIRDIANQLMAKESMTLGGNSNHLLGTQTNERFSVQLISSLIESIITEKRTQFRSKIGIEIEFYQDNYSYGIFSNIQAIEFKRVISNLINNAVEELRDEGNVSIFLTQFKENIEISIRDNGQGIEPHILSQLGQRGKTFGKEEGTGLGLAHAKETLRNWNGNLEIESKIGYGTNINLKLKKHDPPHWFVQELNIADGGTVVILDDDASIHHTWSSRFSIFHDVDLIHFSATDSFINWYMNGKRNEKKILYLIDYEFIGENRNGLDVIESLKISKQSILVSSHFEESEVTSRCHRLGVKLIPKNLAAIVPIVSS